MSRFFLFFCILMLTLCCMTTPGCQAKPPLTVTLTNGQIGELRYPTRNVTGFQDLISGDKTFDSNTLGTLYLPAGASPENRVPVMVILHGSGGEWSGRGKAHAEFLARHGIGSLVVDTFVGRGLTRKVKYIRRLLSVNIPDQLADGFAALELLQTHPFVDGSRIGLMGYSLGGMSTILASFETIARNASSGNHRFALHVSFYAPCIIFPENGRGTGAPVVCLWGEKDEATPKAGCLEMIDFMQKGGNQVQAVWYAQAAHGWNGRTPMKFYESIPNFAGCRYIIRQDGSVLEQETNLISNTDKEFITNSEQCVGYGYTIGHHEETDLKSKQALLEAIQTFMPDQRNEDQ